MLAMASVLMLVALPAYREVVLRAHRVAGKVALMDVINRQERHLQTMAQHRAGDPYEERPGREQYGLHAKDFLFCGSGVSNPGGLSCRTGADTIHICPVSRREALHDQRHLTSRCDRGGCL